MMENEMRLEEGQKANEKQKMVEGKNKDNEDVRDYYHQGCNFWIPRAEGQAQKVNEKNNTTPR